MGKERDVLKFIGLVHKYSKPSTTGNDWTITYSCKKGLTIFTILWKISAGRLLIWTSNPVYMYCKCTEPTDSISINISKCFFSPIWRAPSLSAKLCQIIFLPGRVPTLGFPKGRRNTLEKSIAPEGNHPFLFCRRNISTLVLCACADMYSIWFPFDLIFNLAYVHIFLHLFNEVEMWVAEFVSSWANESRIVFSKATLLPSLRVAMRHVILSSFRRFNPMLQSDRGSRDLNLEFKDT